MEPEDSLIMGNEELSTIFEKESDEFIKSSAEDLIPILRESEDTSGSDSENVLPSSDDFSPIFEEKSVTFSNPLFDSNDFTSSDNESLSDEDVRKLKEFTRKPLFEFDDEYISSDVNPLFDEVLEDIECKVSYDSNLDESTFLVTPLFDSNEDEFFTHRDNVELLLHHDPSISVMSILEGFIDEPPLEENDDLFDLASKENDWKKILYDALIDDLITEDKIQMIENKAKTVTDMSVLVFSTEAAATLIEFELKKILIDKMDKSESYLAAPEHKECYEGLIKSYDLDKTLFSTYGKVYSLKRSRKDKDKDEDPSTGSDRGLKKRNITKDAEPTKGTKAKESQSSSSKGTKSLPKSSGKSVRSEEPEFEVADSDMPQDQEENPGNDDEEPKEKVASKRDWFTKPTQPQDPTDPNWNVGKTPQQGQTQRWLMTLASSADKP
ncbi:hypothetical protein Tco_0530212 [Tanacetum coccineum]